MFFNKKKVIQSTEVLNNDGSLPFGWVGRNHEFTEKISSENRYFLSNYLDSKSKSSKDYCAALKSYVIWLDDTKNMCNAKSNCHAVWFSEIIASKQYIVEKKSELQSIKIQ